LAAKRTGAGDAVHCAAAGANQRFDSALLQEIGNRNRKLPDFKRVGGYLVWEKDFPRTASMKIKG